MVFALDNTSRASKRHRVDTRPKPELNGNSMATPGKRKQLHIENIENSLGSLYGKPMKTP